MAASARMMWRRVRRAIELADMVLEVVDARDPFGTRCREVERLIRSMNKKLIIVINKADLVPRKILEEWKRVLEKEYPTVYLSAKHRLGTRKLWKVIKRHAPQLPVKVAVVGYPKVGKSTIINVIKGKSAAETSPKPGATRAERLVSAATWLRLVDSPGVIPVREDEIDLALKCIVPPEELTDPVPPALELIRRALAKRPEALSEKYGFIHDDPHEFLVTLAKRRGLLGKGGEPLVHEAAKIVIRDWQAGELVFYYTPKDYNLEIQQVASLELA